MTSQDRTTSSSSIKASADAFCDLGAARLHSTQSMQLPSTVPSTSTHADAAAATAAAAPQHASSYAQLHQPQGATACYEQRHHPQRHRLAPYQPCQQPQYHGSSQHDKQQQQHGSHHQEQPQPTGPLPQASHAADVPSSNTQHQQSTPLHVQDGSQQVWQPTGYGAPLSSQAVQCLTDAQQQSSANVLPASVPPLPPAPASPVVSDQALASFNQQLCGAHIKVEAFANAWPWPRITATTLRIRRVLGSGATSVVCDCGRSGLSNSWANSIAGSSQQASRGNRGAEALVAKVIYNVQGHPAGAGLEESIFARERFYYWLVDGIVGFAQLLAIGSLELPSGLTARCLILPRYSHTLDEATAVQRFSIQQLHAVFKPVVQGLSCLHGDAAGRGYVGMHLDLKPGNIMLDAAGAPRICDFGFSLHTATPPGFDALSCTDSSGQLVGGYAECITMRFAQPSLVVDRWGTALSDSFSLAASLVSAVVSEAVLRESAPVDPETGEGLDAWEEQLRCFARGERWQDCFVEEPAADVQQLLHFVCCCIGEGVAPHTCAQLLSTPWMARED